MQITTAARLATLALTSAALLGAAPTVAAQATSPAGDDPAIRAVLDSYLHGLKFNDTLSLHQAFWPQAKLYWVKRDGSLGELSQAQWDAGFAASAGKEEPGDLRVVSLEVTRDAASAKIVEEYPASRYTDYVSLLRIAGRWWIVNKIYTTEARRP